MNAIDLHPEALLDAARKGPLSPPEEHRLQTHLAACAACRLDWEQSREFARITMPTDEDREVAARVWRRLKGRATVPPPAVAPARRRRLPFAGVAAAATLLLGLSSAAAWWVATTPEAAPEEPATVDETSAAEGSRGATARAEDTDGESLVADEESLVVDGATGALDEETAIRPEMPTETAMVAPGVDRPTRRAQRRPVVRPARATAPSSRELFGRATVARREGRYQDAAAGYEALLTAFPGSRDADVARIRYADLLRQQLGAPGRALALFDRTLAAHPQGNLALEARFGRAQALEQLGRADAATAAWRDLVAEHPDSAQARLARRRLGLD